MRGLRVGLVLALLLVAGRLVDVQVLNAGHYERQASEELTQSVVIPALRGSVTDRDGVILATSVPTDMVVADDFQIRHPLTEAKALGPLLHVPATTLAPMLAKHSGYVPLVTHLTTAQAGKISALAFPGITMIDDSIDVQPNGQLAAPVVGTVNNAGTGAAGLEYEYNHALAGHSGHETLLESPSGVPLPGSPAAEKTASVTGTGLQLTLDEPLQYTAEQDLARAIVSTHAVDGEAVVMDVQTGKILAMANLVSTTPSAGSPTPPASAPSPATGPVAIAPTGPVNEAPTNLAVTHVYEPGSVFKLVTFSAALADGSSPRQPATACPTRGRSTAWCSTTPHPTRSSS